MPKRFVPSPCRGDRGTPVDLEVSQAPRRLVSPTPTWESDATPTHPGLLIRPGWKEGVHKRPTQPSSLTHAHAVVFLDGGDVVAVQLVPFRVPLDGVGFTATEINEIIHEAATAIAEQWSAVVDGMDQPYSPNYVRAGLRTQVETVALPTKVADHE